MKKFLLISALMATAATASAGSTLIGVDGKTSQYGNPINPGYAYSGAQCLYTNAELDRLYHVAADGTITSAEISSITFYMYVNYVYSGDFTVTAYAQNVDDTAFALDDYNTPMMFDYQSGVTGSTTFTYDDMVRGNLGEAWENTTVESPAVVPVTINFAEPLKYDGKSIVFTFTCSSYATDNRLFSIDVEKFPGWAPGYDTRSLIYYDSTYPMTTAYKQSDRYLPNLTLDYNVVTEKPAPSVVEGEPTTFAVGDFDNPDLEGASAGQFIPINIDHVSSYCQVIYTPDMLNGLTAVTASTTQTAKITSITFPVALEEGTWPEGSFDVDIYAQTTDATEFPLDSNNKQIWFDIADAVHGSVTIDDNTPGWAEAVQEQFYGDRPTFTVTFDTPIEYTGNTLVLTWHYENGGVSDLMGSDTFMGYSVVYKAADGKTHSAVKSSPSGLLTNISGQIEGKSSYVPVIEIGYTPLTRQSTTQVATIGDVAVSVSQVKCLPKLSLSSEANVLEFAFDINDPANCGSYDVTLNSVNLGTVNGTAVKISFINPNPAQDYVIGITPKADGVIGTTATVTKQQIAVLFHTPAVEVTDWRLLADYNATDTKANVSAAFVCTVSGIDGLAAKYSNSDWCPDLSYGNVGLWGDQAYQHDIPDYLADLQPATATEANYNALKVNGYQFAIAKMNMFEAGVTEAVLTSINKRIWFKSTISLPVAYLATPSLEAVPESINGNSYKAYEFSTTVNVSATLTSDEGHLQTNVTFPEALEIRVDEANARIVVYAPAAATLWYRIVPITAAADTPAPLLMAEPVWQQAATNPWSIGKADLTADAIIELKTLDAADNVLEQTSMVIKSGVVASAATIEADSTATVRYFTPMGVEITPEALTPGTLYIRRTATKAEKIIVR